MTILLNESRIVNGGVAVYDMLPSEKTKIEAGMALARVFVNGKSYVARTTGTNDEYVGMALTPNRPDGVAYANAAFTISSASRRFTSKHSLATASEATDVPQVYVRNANGTYTAYAADAAAADGKFKVVSLDPVTLDFASANDGVTVEISFNYVPTMDDVIARGISSLNRYYSDEDFTGKIPVIVSSPIVVTDKFDASADWNTGGALYALAGGLYGLAGGTLISGASTAYAPAYSKLLSAPNAELGGIAITVNT